ncbi:MAG: RNA methyltransferase, partial [Clostridia bacterium]|nr:RNA methyltransferase [Clostridia bacterium]
MKLSSEIITSRSNPIVKWASSLGDKKYRDAEGAFLIEGEKLSFEALEAGLPVIRVFVEEGKKTGLLPRLERFYEDKRYEKTVITLLSESAFSKISSEKSPQGIIIAIKYLDFFRKLDIIYKEEFFLKPSERAIILCSIRDPGNLGSVIRSAVAFGTEHIILTSDCVDLYNAKTVRAAMGSLFKIKATVVSDMTACIEAIRANGRRVYAAELRENALPLSDIC